METCPPTRIRRLVSPLPWLFCVALLVQVGQAAQASLLHRGRDVAAATHGRQPNPLMAKLKEETGLAAGAEMEAVANSKTVAVTQKTQLADLAYQYAEQDLEASKNVIPEASVVLKKAEALADTARHHADHAKIMADAIKAAPAVAAQYAVAAVEMRIKSQANASALYAMSHLSQDSMALAERVARHVAASMEPYQLGLLRAQKFVAETYHKATSAADQVQILTKQAKQMANDAVAMQASGAGIQAQQLMTEAHGVMRQAANVKAWAQKFYAQADEIDKTVPKYEAQETAAATKAEEEAAPLVAQPPDPERPLV